MSTTSSRWTFGSRTSVPPEPRAPERPFDEPWQARAFALTVALHEGGAFGWDEWANALGAEIETEPDHPYWESWLAALAGIGARQELFAPGDVEAMARRWREAADRTPHGRPITLD